MPSLCAIAINFNDEKSFRAAVKPLIILSIGIDYFSNYSYSTNSKFFYFFSKGSLVFIAGLVSVVNKINNEFTCSHGSEMSYCKLNKISKYNNTGV